MTTTIHDLKKAKDAGRRLAVVTVYDYPSARLATAAGLDVLLVGDSLGMVVHGHPTTLPVTLDDMVRHTAAVVRGAPDQLVVADLPFLTYADEASALRSAGRLMQEAGASAVKLEGGGAMVPIVRRLTALGIPVMAHLGYTPQSTLQIGVRVQAKTPETAAALIEDAMALQAAGAFALVLELVPADLAAEVTRRLSIPTIGIGAGAGCDGQVQVWHDLLGLSDTPPPRHAGRFANLAPVIRAALSDYAEQVRNGEFPAASTPIRTPAHAAE